MPRIAARQELERVTQRLGIRRPPDDALRAKLMGRLASLSELLRDAGSVESATAAIGWAALMLTGASRCAVFVRAQNGAVSCPWSHLLTDGYVRRLCTPPGQDSWAHLSHHPELASMDLAARGRARSASPSIVEDVGSLPAENETRRAAAAEGLRAFCSWPLVRGGGVLGAFVYFFDIPHVCCDAEREVVLSFALQASAVLERAVAAETYAQITAQPVEEPVFGLPAAIQRIEQFVAELPRTPAPAAAAQPVEHSVAEPPAVWQPVEEPAVEASAAARAGDDTVDELGAAQQPVEDPEFLPVLDVTHPSDDVTRANAEPVCEEESQPGHSWIQSSGYDIEADAARVAALERAVQAEAASLFIQRANLNAEREQLTSVRAELDAEHARLAEVRRTLEAEREQLARLGAARRPEAPAGGQVQSRRVQATETERSVASPHEPVPAPRTAVPATPATAPAVPSPTATVAASPARPADARALNGAVSVPLTKTTELGRAYLDSVEKYRERIMRWAEATAALLRCSVNDIVEIRQAVALLYDLEAPRRPDLPLSVSAILRHREENWDGTGRPDGLEGNMIPLGARLLAVTLEYAEMVIGRPGSPMLYYLDAKAALRRDAGKRFDPDVVAAFCRAVERS